MKQQKSKTIFIVARQAGTANAFIPLLEELKGSNFNVKTFAFTHAHNIFAANKKASTLIENFDDFLLGNLPKPSFLLTGTSEYADEDHLFWQWAKQQGITSLAFVDSWIFYWQRFTPGNPGWSRFSYAPDFIAVIDQLMFDRMVESGCEKKPLIITGNPAFDGLRSFVSLKREEIVGKYGEDYFLFIGEPFNERVFGGQDKETLGYTEAEVLRLAADALEMLERPGCKLVFLPHPRGRHPEEVHSIINCHSSIVLGGGEFTSRDLMACAKLVVGMTSMSLFEASVMGVPIISLQPNGKLSSDLINSSRKITIVRILDTDEVCQEMKKVLSTSPDLMPTIKSTLFKDICHMLVGD